MDHNILISKLSAYGISGTSIEWFKSYLSERNQKCFLNGSLSSNRMLSCGTPQGTILGPLLFLLYINDLPNCLMHSQPRMYADDTHLTLAIVLTVLNLISMKILPASVSGLLLIDLFYNGDQI